MYVCMKIVLLLNTVLYAYCLCYSMLQFMQLISLVPTDPTVLQRLGDMYEDSDKSQSFQYYLEVLVTTVII